MRAGDVEGVRAVLREGADFLAEIEDMSPLALAVEKGNAEIVQVLLDAGHSPDLGGIVVPLAEAANRGDMRVVELLLERHARVDEPGEEGETAAMWAAGAGELAVLKRLIEAGADIQRGDREGQDALHYALRGRRIETIEFLLPHYPKARQDQVRRQEHLWRNPGSKKVSQVGVLLEQAINRPEPRMRKAPGESLIRAFESGKEQKFLELLAAGADPNETNKEGTTILGLVASFPTSDALVEFLLKAGADPNRGELFRPLKLAASRGADQARLLLEAGADVHWTDADGATALMAAAKSGDEETIRLLVDAGADPNAEDRDGHTALWYALKTNNKEAADLLAALTSDVENAKRPWRANKEGKTSELCLLAAAEGGDVEHVKSLLAAGVRVDVADESGDTPLHYAAKNNDVEMIGTLLEAHAAIEAEGCGDWTPLVTATCGGGTAAVRKLLGAGANVHGNDDSILCYACEQDHCLELVELLLAAGAGVNVVGGHRNNTPLHVAAEHDETAVVKRLLAAGADVHARDGNGWTPFLTAVTRAGVETVRLLVDAGSDINAVESQGWGAYELASKWGKRETADFVRSMLGK